MPQVKLTPDGEESLLDVGVYVAEAAGSDEIALRLLERIVAKATQYAHQPLMGTPRPDLGNDIRCFTVDKFVVIYEPLDDGITILLVIHGARDIPRVFQKRFSPS